jgi:hypothetical protein
MVARDADSGELLRSFPIFGPIASAAAVLDGELFVGAGVGERGGDPNGEAYQASLAASYVSAFCLPDADDCPQAPCDDGDACTYDFHAGDECRSEPAPDGIPCTAAGQDGRCAGGTCQAGAPGP